MKARKIAVAAAALGVGALIAHAGPASYAVHVAGFRQAVTICTDEVRNTDEPDFNTFISRANPMFVNFLGTEDAVFDFKSCMNRLGNTLG
jgi:hypothetical protein